MTTKYTDTVLTVKPIYTVMDIPVCRTFRDYAEMEFTSTLRRLREEAGLKQADMAEKLDVAQPTYQRWETGKREPSFEDIRNIARTLGVRVSDLFAEDGADPIPSESELEAMIAGAMAELPVGVAFADYPSAVASGLRDRLVLYQAAAAMKSNPND